MEHYFMLICRDISLQESLVLNYIKSLLPDFENIQLLYTDCLPIPLLQCESSCISILNFQENKEKQLYEWREVNEWSSFENIISECKKAAEKNNTTENLDHNISPHINHLADQLPSSGTFKLDVIICGDVLIDLSVSSNLELAGSLYRLSQWHGAHIAIAASTQADQSHLKEWIEITSATLLEKKLDVSLGALVWRGAINSQTNAKLPIRNRDLQLRLDYSENAFLLDAPNSEINTKPRNVEHLLLSSSLNLVDECSFNTIPPYMISPIVFRLSSCNSNDNSAILKYFTDKCDAALIARLGYSVTSVKPKPDKALSTHMWQKTMCSGNIKFPEDSYPITESYMSLVITKSKKSGNIIVYPLSSAASLNSQFYFTYLDTLSAMPKNNTSDGNNRSIEEIKLPYLTETELCTLLNKVNVLQVGSGKKCEVDHSSDPEHVCLQSVLESTKNTQKYQTLCLQDSNLELRSVEIDPTDWPERIHLLQKQIRSEKEKAISHPIFLQNISPQKTQMNVGFKSEDAMKFFEPTGEAKDKTKVETVSEFDRMWACRGLKVEDQDRILLAKWPEVLKLKYDDIYYNSITAETLESMSNGLVRLYVQHETACSCNRDQLYPNAPIPLRPRHRESSQKWKSPAKLRTPKKDHRQRPLSQLKQESRLARHASFSELQSSRLIKQSGTFSRSLEKLAEIGRSRKQLPVKPFPLPVRQSPRKKVPVKYSQSTSSRQPKVPEKTISKTQKLPELSIKKLRVAVAQALENNEINSDHPYFRPCFKRLFTICQAFVQDLPCQKGRTSERMQKIADANVNQTAPIFST